MVIGQLHFFSSESDIPGAEVFASRSLAVLEGENICEFSHPSVVLILQYSAFTTMRGLLRLKKLAALTVLLQLLTVATASPAGECSATEKCAQGCCSSSGYCGFGPEYCGDTCISSCDAKAECGQYAATPGKKCPLNVCCSEFGSVLPVLYL